MTPYEFIDIMVQALGDLGSNPGSNLTIRFEPTLIFGCLFVGYSSDPIRISRGRARSYKHIFKSAPSELFIDHPHYTFG